MAKGFMRRFPPLKILTDEQVEAIHRGTLDVLWQTGIRMEHEEALRLLKKNDCKVDFEKKRVHFPPGLVEECLRKCPSSWRLKGRHPKSDVIIGGNTFYFAPFPGMKTVDLDTWEPKTPTRKEYYDGVTVLDALDNMHVFNSYSPYFGFERVPEVMRILEGLAARIRNSTKPGWVSCTEDNQVFIIEMAKAVGMELIAIPDASPPLTYYRDAIESYFSFVEAGFPVKAGSGVVMGASAPATIAGAIITNNAEIIAGIVLAQLIRPGARVLAANLPFPQNMRTGSPAFGAIGCSLHQAVFNQMLRNYRIPTVNHTPGVSSSKKIDYQCSYEKTLGSVLSVISGANIINLHGGLHGELTHHPLLAILDDDIAGMIGRFTEGIEVDNETLALDLIDEVGPIPGFYLNKEHTRKWWKKEQFIPKAADRLTYPEWIKTGKKDCLDYAKERMEEILSTHKPVPLTPKQEQTIEDILREAREYYRKKGLISDVDWETYMEDLKSPDYPLA